MRAAVLVQECELQSRVGANADSWRALNKWFDSSRGFGFSNTIILPADVIGLWKPTRQGITSRWGEPQC